MLPVGFLLVSNEHYDDFRYALVRRDDNAGYAVRTLDGQFVNIFITKARRAGARLSLHSTLDAETRETVQRAWRR